jgi:hypothetical protein
MGELEHNRVVLASASILRGFFVIALLLLLFSGNTLDDNATGSN